MPLFLVFIIYNIGQILVLPGIAAHIIIRKLRGKRTFGNVWERTGLVPKTPKNKNVFWLHAVSVGEVLSLHGIISEIKKSNPGAFCYVTTGTPSGKEMAQKKLDADCVSFIPIDFLPSMYLAFRRIKPDHLIIVEAELWPNLLTLASWRNVATCLINARISLRSHRNYERLAFFLLPFLKTFKHIYTQTERDTNSFIELGLSSSLVSTAGNIKILSVIEKHEIALKKKINISGKQKNDIILLAGSVHPSEDKIYLQLFQKLKPIFPNLKLVLAPRHFHWKEKLIKNVKQTGYDYAVWDKNPGNLSCDITLICMLGILFDMYHYCDLFFLGGTFVPVGGHNLLEPAVWGKPSIVGPYYHNTTQIADALESKNALIKVSDEDELLYNTQKWLESHHVSGSFASKWIQKQHMSVQQTLKLLIQ